MRIFRTKPYNVFSLGIRGIFSPKARPGKSKYGPCNGLVTKNNFKHLPISLSMAEALSKAANSGLSAQTWSSYKTAKNHLDRCQKETNVLMTFPLTTEKVLVYISWLLFQRKVKAKSAEVYVSGLRCLHLINGHENPSLRPGIVKLILNGQSNLDKLLEKIEGKSKRVAVTIPILKLIKKNLKKSNMSSIKKHLIWSTSTLAFTGGFRIHELLSKERQSYDPFVTLLGKDIVLKENDKYPHIQVLLKTQKKDRIGKDEVVDVFGTNNFFCPIKAYKKYRKSTSKLSFEAHKPVFRTEEGKAYTGKNFNADLKSLLGSVIDYSSMGKVSSHSFRIGITTMLGKLGFSDQEIMAMGRWSSSAFELYIRSPRAVRAETAKRMAKAMERV